MLRWLNYHVGYDGSLAVMAMLAGYAGKNAGYSGYDGRFCWLATLSLLSSYAY
jgi:hypothetical protein